MCCVYEMSMPNCMICGETSFRILRNNFVRLFHGSDDRMPTTSSRL